MYVIREVASLVRLDTVVPSITAFYPRSFWSSSGTPHPLSVVFPPPVLLEVRSRPPHVPDH